MNAADLEVQEHWGRVPSQGLVFQLPAGWPWEAPEDNSAEVMAQAGRKAAEQRERRVLDEIAGPVKLKCSELDRLLDGCIESLQLRWQAKGQNPTRSEYRLMVEMAEKLGKDISGSWLASVAKALGWDE